MSLSALTNVAIYTSYVLFFFFNDTATTEIYTLSLHDALPISVGTRRQSPGRISPARRNLPERLRSGVRTDLASMPRCTNPDRKSTRLNSSHANISYAVFCLKKKKKTN